MGESVAGLNRISDYFPRISKLGKMRFFGEMRQRRMKLASGGVECADTKKPPLGELVFCCRTGYEIKVSISMFSSHD